ncbi:MAG: Fic family protein [Oligoflexia bacterium]|nr:Fic family protein [Oligoflexia bacterium]
MKLKKNITTTVILAIALLFLAFQGKVAFAAAAVSPLPSNGFFYLKQYPQKELWRLFVDGNLHATENGPEGYERREPGSLKGLFEALRYVIVEKPKDITIDSELIFNIHIHVVKGVELEYKAPFNRDYCYRFIAEEIVGYQLSKNVVTLNGLVELLKKMELQSKSDEGYMGGYQGCWLAPENEQNGRLNMQEAVYPGNVSDRVSFAGGREALAGRINDRIQSELSRFAPAKSSFVYLAPRPGTVARGLAEIIESYNKEIRIEYLGQDAQLRVIVDHVQRLEQLHPFNDANLRTFAVILLDRLLMQHGFPPVTLENPNVFDLHSVDELIEVVKGGMNLTKEIIEAGPEADGSWFNFKSSSISKDLQKKLTEWSAVLL